MAKKAIYRIKQDTLTCPATGLPKVRYLLQRAYPGFLMGWNTVFTFNTHGEALEAKTAWEEAGVEES
jgi:hypothetical protein